MECLYERTTLRKSLIKQIVVVHTSSFLNGQTLIVSSIDCDYHEPLEFGTSFRISGTKANNEVIAAE